MSIMPHFNTLLTVAVTLATFSSPCETTCNSFSPFVNPYNNEQVYTATGRTLIASEVVNCTGPNLGSQPQSSVQQRCNETTCSLAMPLEYYVRVNSSLNISVSSDTDLRNIFNLAKLNVSQFDSNVASTDLNVTMVHQLTSVSTCLRNGTAGYWAFTPTLNCVQGVLHGCTGDTSALDGMPITVCGAKMLSHDYGSYDGFINVVYTNGVPLNGAAAPPNATMTSTNPLPSGSARTLSAKEYKLPLTLVLALILLMS